MGFLDIDIHGARAGIFFGRDRLHRRLYAVDREPANLVAVAVEIAESERADARWISGQLRDDEIVVFALLDIEGRGAEGAAYLLMLIFIAGLQRFHGRVLVAARHQRSEEHTSELQSLTRISYAVF